MKTKLKVILAVAGLLLIAGGVGLCFYGTSRPVLKLASDYIYIEAGEVFDPFEMIKEHKNIDLSQIEIFDDVDTSVPAEYPVVYKVGNKEFPLSVVVQDTVSPAVTYKEGPFEYLTTDELSAEMFISSVNDATAVTYLFNENGENLSVAGNHSVSVSVVDQGGNTDVKYIDITLREPDTNSPVISGVTDRETYVGESIELCEGVTVSDDMDPNPQFKMDGNGVDFSQPGEYTAYYIATDNFGNETVESCKVTVRERYSTSENIVPTVKPAEVPYKPEGGTYGWDAAGIDGQPYLVCVNRALCTVTVYSKDAEGNYTVPFKSMACSVGREGHSTPTGRYRTSDRSEWCLMVDNTWGRYAIRINGGIMFHSVCYFTVDKTNIEYEEFNKLGGPASLGCVRLCVADELWLYQNCPGGFPTIIYDDYECVGPIGKPDTIKIDINDEEKRGWDPSDPEYPFN